MLTSGVTHPVVPTEQSFNRPKDELVTAAMHSLDKVSTYEGTNNTAHASRFAFPFRIVIENLDRALTRHVCGEQDNAESDLRFARAGLENEQWTLSPYYVRGSEQERPDEKSVNGERDNTSALMAVMRQISEHLTRALELFEKNDWDRGVVAFGVALQFCVTAAGLGELQPKSPS